MADTPKVYPPRYFVGFLDIERSNGERVRLEFVNAPMIPLNEQCAWIFCGSNTDAYYQQGKAIYGRVEAIQYEITALDGDEYVTHKFHHEFKTPAGLATQRSGVLSIFSRSKSVFGGTPPLFSDFPLTNVLEVSESDQRVIQFIA